MKHAPTVVIVTWQWSEHGFSFLRYETCSVSCHRLMTTVRAWSFISKVWNMLRQLSSSHDNGQSMVIHPEGMKHAPTVVIVTWQRSEHGFSFLRYETCSVSCHRLKTTVRAWLFISKVWNMLRQLSSLFISKVWNMTPQTVVIVSWQRSEHGYSSWRYETCSDSWHRLMTTVRAWFFISKLWNMLRRLMTTVRAWYIVSWQRSEHGNISQRYEPCSVSCYRLMTTVRQWLLYP